MNMDNMPADPMTALGGGVAATVEMWQELVKAGMPQTQASICIGTMLATMTALASQEPEVQGHE
jgi:hypothetical protein